MTARSQNWCQTCDYTWHPRGKDKSDACPSCKSSMVHYDFWRRGAPPGWSPRNFCEDCGKNWLPSEARPLSSHCPFCRSPKAHYVAPVTCRTCWKCWHWPSAKFPPKCIQCGGTDLAFGQPHDWGGPVVAAIADPPVAKIVPPPVVPKPSPAVPEVTPSSPVTAPSRAPDPRREPRRSDRDDFDDRPARRRPRPDRQPPNGVNRGLLIAGAILAVPVLFVVMCCGITMLSPGGKPDAKAKGQQPDKVVRVHDDFPANKAKVIEIDAADLRGRKDLLNQNVRVKGRVMVAKSEDGETRGAILVFASRNQPFGSATATTLKLGPIDPESDDRKWFTVTVEGVIVMFLQDDTFMIQDGKVIDAKPSR